MSLKSLKIILLPLLFGLAVTAVYLLPRSGEVAEPSVSMTLPLDHSLNGWVGVARQESERERQLLADDTEFSKADYQQNQTLFMDMTGQTRPVLCHVSLVKSGSDLNNSIHRPERCLPAQGHFNLQSQVVQLEIPGYGVIALTKLKSQQNLTPDRKESFILDSMHYYVFLGHKNMTESHLVRTLADMKDRVLFGIDQRWVYFQISTPYGDNIGLPESVAAAETEKLIIELLTRLIKWDELNG